MARLLEIDRLKGLAILGVMLIHARPLVDTYFYDLFVVRSAQVFIVLFGVNSYLWWQRRESMSALARVIEWYVSRFWRLMPPVWGMLAVWWPMQLALWRARLTEMRFLIVMMFGYLPWVGTGWFVSAIITLVIAYPAFFVLFELVGPASACVVGFAATLASVVYQTSIIEWMRELLRNSVPFVPDFYLWIFPPVFAWHVAAGAYIARRWPDERHRITALATGLGVLLLVLTAATGFSQHLRHALQVLLDVPIAVASLWVLAWLPDLGFVDRILGWLAVRTWGLYLGQLLVQNACFFAGLRPYEGSRTQRWVYFFILLGGAVVLTEIGQRLRQRLPFGNRLEKDTVT